MNISKKYMELMFLVLKDTTLSLKDARIRDAFMKSLETALNRFYDERKKIYEKFCTKNEDGTPKIEEDKFHFPPESIDELSKELTDLADEEVEIKYEWGVTPEGLKSIIESTSYQPKVGEALAIDHILESLEPKKKNA